MRTFRIGLFAKPIEQTSSTALSESLRLPNLGEHLVPEASNAETSTWIKPPRAPSRCPANTANRDCGHLSWRVCGNSKWASSTPVLQM